MSLQVWLPLNGDLHNQGLSDLSFSIISDTNTTIDNDGKIGKCYSNDSHTAGGLISDEVIELGQQQSMFCWFKFTDLHSGASLGGSLISQHRTSTYTGMGITIRYVSATTGYLSVSTGNGSSRTYNTYYGTTLLQANTWYHGGYTYDGSTIKIYVNGICEKTQAFSGMSVPADYISCFCWNLTGTSGNTIQANYKLQGSLNDVRVYDHCLSEMEVKKLAQGLIVHYPLNRHGLGQENLLADTATESIATSADNSAYPSPTTYLTDSGNEIFANTEDYFTYSCNYEVTGNSATGAYIYTQARGSTAGGSLNVYNNPIGHYSHTFQLNDTQAASTNKYCRIRLRNATDGAVIKIWNSKLEKGSIETPWSPASSDELATTMGLNSTTEYDCSGFCNNATNFTASEWSSDTPKYSVSTIFDETVSADVSNIYDSTSRHKQLTIATWIKRTSDDANYHYYWNNSGVRLGIRTYNNVNNYYWISWTHATDSAYEDHGWVTTVMPKDIWVHVAWVFDSGVWKQYVNGVLNGTRNDSGHGTYVYGDVGSILGNSWIGNLSDFRIYATALSAEDVKSLYQNCATIAADGTIYGQIYS